MALNPIASIIAIPLAAGVLCLFLTDRFKTACKLLTLVVTTGAFAESIRIFFTQKPLTWGFLSPGADALFVADSLACLAAMGIGLFGIVIAVYSTGFVEKHISRYFGYYLMTLGAAFGVLFSNHIILMTVFWGFLAATFFLMINLADTDGAAAASKKAFIIIGGTDSLLILGICFLWILSGSFTINKIHVSVTSVFALSAFILMASAAFAKAGCMPFHSWFADVAEEAPTPVVAYLPASLDKLLGIYLLARLSLNIFEMTALSNTILMFAGSATILYASSLAIFQTRMKRLLGYCAVSQVGYMVVGIGTGNPIGIAGGLLHMVNHALYKSCLFLSGGVVEKKTGTSDLEKLGGLVKLMPWTFATFLVASLSVTGVPPFNGFASKWMVYQGIIESAKHGSRLWVLWLIAAMFGSAFTLASFTKLLHAVFMGPVRPEMKKIREGHWLLIVPPAILAVLCLGFGLFAFSSVLPGLVAPIVGGVALTGLWNPLVAAGLLLAGLAMGWLLFLAGRGGSVRTAKPFIGGEDIETFSHYPGVDCYETVKDTKLFGSLTGADRTGRFDVYAQAGALVNKLSQAFGRLHNGVLPTYLVWPLLGMIAMFAVFFGKF